MFHIHNYYGFLATILLFSAVPGAGTIAILDATARGGRHVGLAAVMGTLCGDLIIMLASVAGLAAVMHRHPQWLLILQWFGVLYLVYLAWKMLSASKPASADTAPVAAQPFEHFLQACLVSLTNPKVLLFFVAFFPLFMSIDARSYTLPVMMVHVTLISALWQLGLVIAGNAVAQRLRVWPQAHLIANRVGGVALLLLALRLAPPWV